METIDKAVFDDLRDTAGVDFVAELVDTFFEEAPRILADLRSALDTADAERYRRAAHSLKSNGDTFGASDFAARARAIEVGGFATEPAKDRAAVDALEAAYARAAGELKALTHG